MLEVKLGRYDSSYCVEQFEAGQPQIIGQEAIWAFDLNEEEFEVYIPALDGQPDPAAFASAKDVMKNITLMDDLVQKSSASECEKTGIDPKNYMLYLAYAKVEEDKASLCYYGEKVNTEWDAIFIRENGNWNPTNFK